MWCGSLVAKMLLKRQGKMLMILINESNGFDSLGIVCRVLAF
jgi:hypothetical protein